LADTTGGRSDQEVDARTVMAVMNIENLAPAVYTCAEVLDRKHVEYLRLAHCDEIILSREHERALLVGASVSSGLSAVVRTLLEPSREGGIRVEAIPEEFVGRSFGELALHLRATTGELLVGLLENTGQAIAIKREALRAAQKTDNVTTLLGNLRAVKDLVTNRPLLNPAEGHPIGRQSMAIVIAAPSAGEQS
jgi:voltage-gated potassium channel